MYRTVLQEYPEEMMEKDSIGRFSGKADLYAAGRPSYAAAFLQWLKETCGIGPSSRAADVGAGTGKFTKQLLELGCDVYAVEPNADMRRIAERELGGFPGFHSVHGDASASGLPDHSMDVITAAQAFHWFPAEEFRRECLRIGKEDCLVFLIWNERDLKALAVQALQELYAAYGRDFRGFNLGLQEDDERIRRFFRDDYQRVGFDNPLHYDREGFRVRCLSSSHSPREGEADRPAYEAGIDRIFDRFAEQGRLEMPNKTNVYYGKLCTHKH